MLLAASSDALDALVSINVGYSVSEHVACNTCLSVGDGGHVAAATAADAHAEPAQGGASSGAHRAAIRRRAGGRGVHSSTFRLNVSTFCGIRRVHDFPPVY